MLDLKRIGSQLTTIFFHFENRNNEGWLICNDLLQCLKKVNSAAS